MTLYIPESMEQLSKEGNDVLSMSYFDFIPIGTKLIGDKIRDTPKGELQ